MSEKNYGFIPDEIKPEDYIFGAEQLPLQIIRPDGQWDNFLPDREMQRDNGLETMNCTNYGTINALEIIHIALYGEQKYWAERYLGVMSGTTQNGNSAQTVAETIRKKSGLIDDALLPFSSEIDTWNEYYSPKPMTENYINEGMKWLGQYDFGHEWVPTNAKALMDALKYSPLGISVCAWKLRNGLYWKNSSDRDNHWCVLFGFEKNKYWKIFDSYDNCVKHCEWNYAFQFAKRYYLKKKSAEDAQTKMTKEKLEQIYQELLMRSADVDSLPYLNLDEEAVRQSVGQSEERLIYIRAINFIRATGMVKFFDSNSILGRIFGVRKK